MVFGINQPFLDSSCLPFFATTDEDTVSQYGPRVRATEMSNVDYSIRYQKMGTSQKMKPPPRHGRIFHGYLVVRNIDSKHQYETWMTPDVFEDLYNVESL